MGQFVEPGLQAITWAVHWTDRKGVDQVAYHTTGNNAWSHVAALHCYGMTQIYATHAYGVATADIAYSSLPREIWQRLRELYRLVPPIRHGDDPARSAAARSRRG